MKVKLLVDILFEYAGMKKTMFKSGQILNAKPSRKWIDGEETDIQDGYWINNGERTIPAPGKENPGSLFETKCLLSECEVVT